MALGLVVALCAFSVAACDETVSTVIVNTSAEPLVLRNTGGHPERIIIPAQGEVSMAQLPGRGLNLVVERTSGAQVFSGKLTWRELQDRRFRVAVTLSGLQ